MSNYGKNESNHGGSGPDYDKQFQEDLERAQALSLESLALEKFKMQKQLEYSRYVQRAFTPQKDNSPSGSNVSEVDNSSQSGDK